MEILDPVAAACHGDRLRLLEVFRGAIAKPFPTSQTAVATMVEAVKPQKQTVLVQDENQLLENGLRTLLEELVSAAVENGKSVMQYGRAEGLDGDGNGLLTRLLDIVLYLCEKGNVEGGMIFQLLEDLTEVSTIKDCKEVFAYIEGKQETLGKSELFSRGKLVMLRTCNQLLRRLSKTNDVVFCGRILMFLAHFFPLSERSAVNIKGVFNTSNETKYEKEAPGDGAAFDFTFYKTFWSLQEYFSNPAALMHNNPSKWQTFSSNLATVLEAFEVQPLGEEDESLSLDGDDDDSTFNIKYLTSCNLMSLELKDPGFRRHVLVQCLIIFDYLKTPGKAEKDGPREAIREELKVHEDRVKKLLRTTPPKGREFLASIEHILERDKNWVWWKRDGCTPFERSVQEKKPSSEPARRKPRWRLGNRELHRLWKWSEDNPNAITDAKRAKMPPLSEYFKPLAEDMDPEAGIEEEYHRKNNKVYCWKGLRFAARQDLEALSRYSDMKIMGVVPPEVLTPEVRSSLYKTSDRPKAKGVKKEEDGSTPNLAQTEDATGNVPTGVSLMELDATTPAQDPEDPTAMEAQGPAVAEVEPEPEPEQEPEAEPEPEQEPEPEPEPEPELDVKPEPEPVLAEPLVEPAVAQIGSDAKPEPAVHGEPSSPKVVSEPVASTPKSESRSGRKRPHPDD